MISPVRNKLPGHDTLIHKVSIRTLPTGSGYMIPVINYGSRWTVCDRRTW
jgi:hypothetical protein